MDRRQNNEELFHLCSLQTGYTLHDTQPRLRKAIDFAEGYNVWAGILDHFARTGAGAQFQLERHLVGCLLQV